MVTEDGKKFLGFNYLKQGFESRKVLNPYNEDNADLDKIVHRNYLLENYGVEAKNRDIVMEDVPPEMNQNQALGMKTLKRKTLSDIDNGPMK